LRIKPTRRVPQVRRLDKTGTDGTFSDILSAGGTPLTRLRRSWVAHPLGFALPKGAAFDFPFSCAAPIHKNHSPALITVQPSFATIRCKTLNVFIKVCYPLPCLSNPILADRPAPTTFRRANIQTFKRVSPLIPLPPILHILFQVPYPASPLFATLTKTPGVWGYSSRFGTHRRADISTYRRFPIPCLFKLLRTLLRAAKTQLFSFQAILHSLPKTTRGGGAPASHLAAGKPGRSQW
jgi:hypothetical protein